jgi:predicted nucleic acid-binding protein
MPFVLIDTNVLVSGVLTSRHGSPTHVIVEAMLGGSLRFLLSETLLAEYLRVLSKPHLIAQHGMSRAELDRFLLHIVLNATMRDPSFMEESLDHEEAVLGDEHIVALLRAMPGSTLVTGDGRLAEAVKSWCIVLNPAEFVVTLPSRQQH